MSEVMEYVVLTPNDLEDVIDILIKHYFPRENQTVGAGLNPVDSSVGLVGKSIRACLASGLSVGARDQATGRLVGLITNNILTAPPKLTQAVHSDHFSSGAGMTVRPLPQKGMTLGCDDLTSELTLKGYVKADPSGLIWPPYAIQLMLAKTFKIYEMCWKMVDVFQDPGVVRVLEIERACVHSDYGRRGIFKEMMQMSISLGSKHDCQLARLDVTSPYTEKVCIRMGFDTRLTLDLHTLEDGIFDLSLMTYKVNKVMTKRLSP